MLKPVETTLHWECNTGRGNEEIELDNRYLQNRFIKPCAPHQAVYWSFKSIRAEVLLSHQSYMPQWNKVRHVSRIAITAHPIYLYIVVLAGRISKRSYLITERLRWTTKPPYLLYCVFWFAIHDPGGRGSGFLSQRFAPKRQDIGSHAVHVKQAPNSTHASTVRHLPGPSAEPTPMYILTVSTWSFL